MNYYVCKFIKYKYVTKHIFIKEGDILNLDSYTKDKLLELNEIIILGKIKTWKINTLKEKK